MLITLSFVAVVDPKKPVCKEGSNQNFNFTCIKFNKGVSI